MTEEQEVLETEEIETVEAPEGPTPEQIAAQEEARKFGWKPKEEFNLAPEGWVDADRFLELPSTQNKMLRDELKELRTQSAKADETFAERLERLDRANKAAMKAAMDQKDREFANRMAELQREQRKAVELGDVDEFDRLERARQQMKPPEKVEEPEDTTKADTHKQVEAWRETRPWAKDPFVFSAAIQATQTPENTNKSIPELLEVAEQKARTYFPHLFEAPKPKQSRVDGGGLAGGSRGKGANDLPAEAVAAGKEFVSSGIFKSLDDYAKDYFAQG